MKIGVKNWCIIYNKCVLCIDVDECSDNTDNCNINAICSNNHGSFNCQCKAGFSGDGISCSSKAIILTWYNVQFFFRFFFHDYYLLFLDINECLTNPCGSNASCTDNEGSFVCKCGVGYSGNGFVCSGECDHVFT